MWSRNSWVLVSIFATYWLASWSRASHPSFNVTCSQLKCKNWIRWILKSLNYTQNSRRVKATLIFHTLPAPQSQPFFSQNRSNGTCSHRKILFTFSQSSSLHCSALVAAPVEFLSWRAFPRAVTPWTMKHYVSATSSKAHASLFVWIHCAAVCCCFLLDSNLIVLLFWVFKIVKGTLTHWKSLKTPFGKVQLGMQACDLVMLIVVFQGRGYFSTM